MIDEIRVQDIGIIFIGTIHDQNNNVVDISSATSFKKMYFAKPDGSLLTKDASFTTDGTDGKLQYTSVADDLNIPGMWQLQARFTISAGTFSSDRFSFKVHKNLWS